MNCSRGPVVDEVALVEHLRENPMFRVGLDVFEVITIVICSFLLIPFSRYEGVKGESQGQ